MIVYFRRYQTYVKKYFNETSLNVKSGGMDFHLIFLFKIALTQHTNLINGDFKFRTNNNWFSQIDILGVNVFRLGPMKKHGFKLLHLETSNHKLHLP